MVGPLSDVEHLSRLRRLIRSVGRAADFSAVLEEALDGLHALTGVERSSVLLFDDAGVMRFRAWRGLSAEYRRAVDGHSPWTPETRDADPVIVRDVLCDESLAEHRPTFARENIRALAFIPLVGAGGVIGKFMLYYAQPHDYTAAEIELALLIASHIAFAVERFASEERQRRSSEQLEVILRGVGEGISMFDPDGRLVYANDAAARILGYANAQALRELVDADPVVDHFVICDEDGRPVSSDSTPSRRARLEKRETRGHVHYRRHDDDELRCNYVTSTPVLDPNGEVQFVVNIFRDITDQRRLESRAMASFRWVTRLQQVTAALSEARTMHEVARTVTAHAIEAVGARTAVLLAHGDEAGRFTALAAAGEDAARVRRLSFGPAGSARLDPGSILVLDEAERASMLRELDFLPGSLVAVPGGPSVVLLLSCDPPWPLRPDAREFLVTLGAQCQQALDRARIYDEERRARQRAEMAERRSAFLLEASGLFSASLECEDSLTQVARAAVPVMADWCSIDLLDDHGGLTHVALHHRDPDEEGRARRARQRFPMRADDPRAFGGVLETGAPVLLRRFGEPGTGASGCTPEQTAALVELDVHSIIVVPIRGRERPLGVIIFARSHDHEIYDEADLRVAVQLGERAGVALENARLLAAERTARDEAAQAERRKDEFLAMLGHELRNPLAPIVTALELMKLDPDETSARRAHSIIERHVRYMQRLVDDLLDLSRITNGKLELRREKLELFTVVTDAIEVASPAIEQRRHHLEVRVPRRGFVIRGDRIRLAQVVANLLTNAAKYTPPDGRILVDAIDGGDTICLRVSDNGMGIEPDLLPRLFDQFVQGRATGESLRGLGLGLTIVRQLVELHGGNITAYSAGPGRGAQFDVTLPRAVTTQERIRIVDIPISTPPAEPVQRRILIVDDNLDAAELLAMALERSGFKTKVAEDGPSALAEAATFEPHIGLLDIGLPVMDGYELARRLRESRLDGSLRLIAITGYGQAHDRRRAAEAGFVAHFVKPVALEALLSAIHASAKAS